MKRKSFTEQVQPLCRGEQNQFPSPQVGKGVGERKEFLNARSEFRNSGEDVDPQRARRSAAFTLAEVLITIGIIGVVAAITIPSLVSSIAERSNSEKEANTVQKINKSMDLMRADGKLMVQYESTDKFVDELVKYLRVTTRCKASEITKCWPTVTVKTSDGEVVSVSDYKTGKNLHIKGNTTNNVGLVLNDGTALLLTYNQNSAPISDGDTVTPGKKSLPIGGGKRKEFQYGSSVMDSIDFVMDVNGFRGPNSETRNDKLYDIRSFRAAKFGYGCPTGLINIPGVGKVCNMGTPTPINCATDNSASPDYKYCFQYAEPSGYANDYWAGARKTCDELGMTFPDTGKLEAIYNTHAEGLPQSGRFWASKTSGFDSQRNRLLAFYVDFSNGAISNYYGMSSYGALCVDE